MILRGIFLAYVLASCALAQQPAVNRTAERAALVALYDAMGGPSWFVSTHWKSATVDHCKWFGVACDESAESAVTLIILSVNNLRGTLPSDVAVWGAFTRLAVLFLNSNAISGTLPNELSASSMEQLHLGNNSLRGGLPKSYAVWSQLVYFDVSINRISGTIPEEYANWTLMNIFVVSNNSLRGTLPPAFGSWTTMSQFFVDDNSFSGKLPEEYAAWSMNLTMFVVDSNMLTGSLPASYGRWKQLIWFRAASNDVSGTLPASYASWTELQKFHIEENRRIDGTLPSEYGAWTAIVLFYAYSLSLTGTLPSSYKTMSSLQAFLVYDNQFSGTLPESYANWSSIFTIQAHNTGISGTLPSIYGTSWMNMSIFILSNTSVSGTIPNEWGSMRNMTVLMLHVNRLTGTLPASLGGLGKLTTLTLGDNNFDGTVPFSAWSQLRNIQVLLLEDNPRLFGDIPVTFGRIFTPFIGLFSVCRSNVCGPALPELFLGYGCMPQFILRNHTLTQENGISIIQPYATFSHTAVCPVPPIMRATTASSSQSPSSDGDEDDVPSLPSLSHSAQQASTAAPFFTLASGLAGGSMSNVADLQMLSGILHSSCMCGVASSSSSPSVTTSNMKYTTSPFVGLGLSGVVVGNTGLVAVVALVQWLVVRVTLKSSTFLEKVIQSNSTEKRREDLHRAAPAVGTLSQTKSTGRTSKSAAAMLPRSLNTVRQVEAFFQFPNVSLRATFLLLPGVFASSCSILFRYSSNTTMPAEVVAAVFGFLYTAVVLVAVEVLVFQCRVLAVPLKFVPVNFAELLPTVLGPLSRRKKLSKAFLSRGTWEPKMHARRFGCVVGSLRGGCEQLWRCMPALNLVVQLLSAIPVTGSVGCGVVQLLTALLTVTLGVVCALKQPTRVWFASMIKALSLCLTASLSISGMLCREGIVSEDAVLGIGLAVSIIGMLSSVNTVLVSITERWLMKRCVKKNARHGVMALNLSNPLVHNEPPGLPSTMSRISVSNAKQHGVAITTDMLEGDGPLPLHATVTVASPASFSPSWSSTTSITSAPSLPSIAADVTAATLRRSTKTIVIFDTRVERLEELIKQICSNHDKHKRLLTHGGRSARYASKI